MKRLDIITRPENLETVKQILAKNEYSGMTVTAAMGCGNQRGEYKAFEELNLDVHLLPNINIMIVILDEDFEEIIIELTNKLSTGQSGDGKIFVSTVDEIVRIRTGERGDKLL